MITEALIPFMIFITNPIGSSPNSGLTVPMYEKFVETGAREPKAFETQAACQERLETLQSNFAKNIKTNQLMPEYRMVMIERVSSMRCMPADSRPDVPMKNANTGEDFRWRIGRVNIYGEFEGQSFEIRHFKSKPECMTAYDAMLVKRREEMLRRNSTPESVNAWQSSFTSQYSCRAVASKRAPPGYWR